MNTYTEQQGEKPFDWNNFIERAIHGQASEEEMEEATSLSMDWITCGCGNQCSDIPRTSLGRPIDDFLTMLGSDFSIQINERSFFEAKITLMEIEKRSAEILMKMGKEVSNA